MVPQGCYVESELVDNHPSLVALRSQVFDAFSKALKRVLAVQHADQPHVGRWVDRDGFDHTFHGHGDEAELRGPPRLVDRRQLRASSNDGVRLQGQLGRVPVRASRPQRRAVGGARDGGVARPACRVARDGRTYRA